MLVLQNVDSLRRRGARVRRGDTPVLEWRTGLISEMEKISSLQILRGRKNCWGGVLVLKRISSLGKHLRRKQ